MILTSIAGAITSTGTCTRDGMAGGVPAATVAVTVAAKETR